MVGREKNAKIQRAHKPASSLELRVQREQATYEKGLDRAVFNKFLKHLTKCLSWQKAIEFQKKLLAVANDKVVLEIGANSWAILINLNKTCPKQLICTNISEKELEKGIKKAKELGHYDKIDFRIMDAHNLALPDNSVDIVYGRAILHHLEFEQGIKEIKRVLKPGGFITFSEPLRPNPIAMLIRFFTPNARTPDERPLGFAELRLLRKNFHTKNRYFQLFAFPASVVSGFLFKNPINPLTMVADKIDFFIEKFLPFVRPFFRVVIIHGEKK